jgi:hypothetical protein
MARRKTRNEHLWTVNTQQDPNTSFQILTRTDDAEAATIKAQQWLDKRSEKLGIEDRKIKQIRYCGTIDAF